MTYEEQLYLCCRVYRGEKTNLFLYADVIQRSKSQLYREEYLWFSLKSTKTISVSNLKVPQFNGSKFSQLSRYNIIPLLCKYDQYCKKLRQHRLIFTRNLPKIFTFVNYSEGTATKLNEKLCSWNDYNRAKIKGWKSKLSMSENEVVLL